MGASLVDHAQGKKSMKSDYKRKFPRGSKRSTCRECRKFSRKTFYCSKWLKVFEINRKACMYFRYRRRPHKPRKKVK